VNGWPGGEEATLMVRPESIHVGEPGAAPEGALRGRIVQTSFLGSQTRIAISCDPVDALVTASAFGRERIDTSDLARDREVALWWSPDDAVLLSGKTTQGEEEE
jgi:ABC-type Fe3+/spermidine/putrescine transport system ATPase subunit